MRERKQDQKDNPTSDDRQERGIGVVSNKTPRKAITCDGEDSQTTKMNGAMKQMPFDAMYGSSPTQDREQETREGKRIR